MSVKQCWYFDQEWLRKAKEIVKSKLWAQKRGDYDVS